MKSPPKREGALLQAPIPKLDWTETTVARAALQPCRHSVTTTKRLPDSHRHFARLTCALCGRHLRWLPKPSTMERRALNAFRLARLAMRPDLTDWERQFIRSVGEKKHLSPKQQALVERLCREYLEAKAP